MAQFQDGDSRVIHGITYVRQYGQWLPSQPAQQAPPFMDPRIAPQAQKAGNEAVASQYAPATAGAEAKIKTAEAANATAVANAQRDKAIADAIAAQAQAQQAQAGGPRIDAAQRAKAIQQYNYAKQLEGVVDHLNQLYTAGPGSTSGVGGLKDFLPTAPNKNFDNAANAARGIVGQALNFTGGQLNTPQEAERAVGPYLPESSNFDSTILQKIQTLQDMAANGKANAIQTLGGEPDANGNVHPVQPQAPAPNVPPAAQPQDQVTNATGKTREQIDPVLKAVAGRVGNMISAGASDKDIIGFLQKNGVDPANTNIGEALRFRQTSDFKRWQRANPGKSYPVGPNFYTKEIPMSEGRQLFNRTAATDIGGDVAAGLAASANAITGGRLDDVTGPNGQIGMDLLRTNHPGSSFAGDMAGQATLEALAGTVPGVRGLMATRMGRRGADALYGAYSGSGEDNSDQLTGGLEGAASGLGFGMFGRGLQRGLGRAATGVRNAHLQYLNGEGIPLTIGQIARGSENTLGHAVGGIEERMAGLPVADAIINSARKRGDHAFNEAAFRQMGATGTGATGLQSGQKVVNDAYSFLDPLQIPTDVPFEKAQAGIRSGLGNLPAFGKEVGLGLDAIDNATASGALSGRDWQSALRNVKADKASINGQPFARPASEALGNVENNLVDLANRQVTGLPAGQLSRANKLNAQLQTLAAALDNGPAQKQDEIFSASGLDNASRLNARNFGGRIKSLTGNRPFYDLTSAGKAVMPNLTPDSGTAGRAILYSTLLGSGLGSGIGALGADSGDRAEGGMSGAAKGLAIASLLSAPYSKTGQKALQKALLAERPKRLMDFGNFLINNPRLAGMFGSSVGRDYFFQPELPAQ
jgi:hypothetical protein